MARRVDGQRWITGNKQFLFPTRALSRVFRGKYIDALKKAQRAGKSSCPEEGGLGLDNNDTFDTLLTQLHSQDWAVYAKPPFASAERVVSYLGRYTHCVAISNHRLIDFDSKRVRFRWRDYAHGNKQMVLDLSADEFIRRFILHVLPRGLMHIRHYALQANRDRYKRLTHCRNSRGKQSVPQRRKKRLSR